MVLSLEPMKFQKICLLKCINFILPINSIVANTQYFYWCLSGSFFTATKCLVIGLIFGTLT